MLNKKKNLKNQFVINDLKKIELKLSLGYETMITLQKGRYAKTHEVKFPIIKKNSNQNNKDQFWYKN